jgi:hypothetical protein
MPDDAWENTEAGKKAIRQSAEWEQELREWKQKTGKWESGS